MNFPIPSTSNKDIEAFVSDHRPSREDAEKIQLARGCIVSDMSEPSRDCLEVAEHLYELARLLYQEKFEEFHKMLVTEFSLLDQKNIETHVAICEGNLNFISSLTIRIKAVQGILGYSHILANYYLGPTPYPSMIEVHNIFQELDLIEQIEGPA